MSPLHHFGEFLRELLLGIPLGVVRALFLGVLGLILLWVLLLPREETRPTSDSPPRLAENLKLWAALALAIQLAVYSWL